MNTVAAIALALVTFSASAGYLVYWDVEGAENLYPADSSNTALEFSYATIKTDTSSDYLKMYDTNGETEYWKLYALNENARSTGAAYSGEFDPADTKSFLVELWSYDDTRLGWQTFSLSQASSAIFDADGFSQRGSVTAVTLTQFVPEPTSGLLLLLGMAGLALRRKKFTV